MKKLTSVSSTYAVESADILIFELSLIFHLVFLFPNGDLWIIMEE